MIGDMFFTAISLSAMIATSAPAEAEPPARQHPATVRYAVIVGSNAGTDPLAGKLPDLQHAEREVRKLRDSLIRFANFDPSPERTVLLAGAKRDDVARAIARIAAQVEVDEKTFGDSRTLFAFFFTGHGLSERLLLEDGPIYARELVEMLQSIRADFTVGFFDACFSGSLTADQLTAKGVRSTPGLNIFRELPEDTLGAEGSVWFVSSAPNEASYEDRELGGVFTHFFIEALEHAEPDGPGITLDRIWSYARKQTVVYTAARQRAQTPQEVVTRLKASAPLYFSFPRKRDAKLLLSSSVRGKFILVYDGGDLSEILHKERGTPLELPVYSGRGRLIVIGEGPERAETPVALVRGGTLVLEHQGEEHALKRGEITEILSVKGVSGTELRAELITRRGLLSVGPGYQLTLSQPGVLHARHEFSLGARWDGEVLIFAVRAAYGTGSETFDRWAYDLRAYSADARAGVAIELEEMRLGILAGVGGAHLEQRYRDGSERTTYSISPLAGIEALVRAGDRLAITLFVEGGLLFTAGAGAAGERVVSPVMKLGAMPMIIF